MFLASLPAYAYAVGMQLTPAEIAEIVAAVVSVLSALTAFLHAKTSVKHARRAADSARRADLTTGGITLQPAPKKGRDDDCLPPNGIR